MNLTGIKFGRWTATEYSKHNNRPAWVCTCECGTTRNVRQSFLLSGMSTSCGCKRAESVSISTRKHGLTGDPLYKVWNSMKERCRNSNNPAYHNYGGRGIRVCDEWMEFEKFYEWSMNNGYQKGLEIDRIENDSNYDPSNCRFVTSQKNANNRRTNHFITINSITKTLSEWSYTSGINRATLRSRVINGLKGLDVIQPLKRKRS